MEARVSGRGNPQTTLRRTDSRSFETGLFASTYVVDSEALMHDDGYFGSETPPTTTTPTTL